MRCHHLLLPAVLLSIAGTATAQVGHPPGGSPYRDIRRGQTLTAVGGHISGDGGGLGVGPQDGSVFGVRYDFRSSRALQLGAAIMYGDLERLIVDPYVPLNQRVSGPVSQSVTFTEFNLQLNLTGGKSWNRFAPFVATGAGLAIGGNTPADTSRYEFGTKFYLAPTAGFRLFLSQAVHLRAEARVAFWKLSYPVTYQQEPPLEPGTPPDNSNAVITDGNVSEWTANPWFQFGLGVHF